MIRIRGKGFTLVELIVVIAIIGILSAVVLASLSAVRNKGRNAAIQANLSTIRTQAQLYYQSNNNSYGATYGLNACRISGGGANVFNQDPIVRAAVIEADKAAGGNGDPATISAPPGSKVKCSVAGVGGVYYTVWVPLADPIGSNTYWCVDSSGNSKSEPTSAYANGLSSCP